MKLSQLNPLIAGVALCSVTAMSAFALPRTLAAATPLRTVKVSLDVLAGQNGMSLYVFDPDLAQPGHSICTGPCAAVWPAILAPEGELPPPLSVVVRPEGTRQLAFKGRPLYFYQPDQKPGDILGDGVHGVWHVVHP